MIIDRHVGHGTGNDLHGMLVLILECLVSVVQRHQFSYCSQIDIARVLYFLSVSRCNLPKSTNLQSSDSGHRF